MKFHPWKPGTILNTVLSSYPQPLWKEVQAGSVALLFIPGIQLVMYVDCDDAGDGAVHMVQVIYKDQVGWAYKNSFEEY